MTTRVRQRQKSTLIKSATTLASVCSIASGAPGTGLTPQQKCFCAHIANRSYTSQAEAYQAAFPACKSIGAARVGAARLSRRDDVRQYVDSLLPRQIAGSNGIGDEMADSCAEGRAACPHCGGVLPATDGADPAAIIARLVQLASSPTASAAQDRANEVLAKIQGMLVDRSEQQIEINVRYIDASPLARLHQLRDARQQTALEDQSAVIDADIVE